MTFSATPSGASYDAIVVGAGVAGCVMARRLSDGGRSVLLIEAGPGEPRPPSVQGIDTIAASQEARRLWPDANVAGGPGREARPYRQGFGLGGGSMVNSLVLSPGDRVAYDRWRTDHGCDWGADDMAPWLDAATAAFPGEPIGLGPVGSAFASAAEGVGHPIGGTSLDQGRAGVVVAQLAKRGARRWSAADAYALVESSVDRRGGSNPAIRTDTSVETILVDEHRRANGVVTRDGQHLSAPLVVLCCGALQTPAVLHRSGLTDRPVGVGLKDHPSFGFTVQLQTDGERDQRARAVSAVLRWSSSNTDDLDLQAIVVERADDGVAQPPMAVVVVGLMRVTSSGSVLPTGTTALADTGALQTADDRDRLRRGVLAVRDLLVSSAMSSMVDEVFIDDLGTPVAALAEMDDDELDRWIADHPGPYAHPGCSCPMGDPSDVGSVVSGQAGELGRLLGYEGIYLADASIMPDLVNGGLQLPVAAMAERIAMELLDR